MEYYKENSYIGELIKVLKAHYVSGNGPSDLKICDDLGFTVPKNMNPYLKREPNDAHIDPYLFEFFVYRKVYHEIERGRLYCNDSVSYCDIDADLVDDALVDDVEQIAAEFGYSKIPIYCDQRLDEALQELNDAWERTTHNIRENNNPGFSVRETKTGQQYWSLLYDSVEKLDDAFFKKLPKVDITNIVMFIGDRIGIRPRHLTLHAARQLRGSQCQKYPPERIRRAFAVRHDLMSPASKMCGMLPTISIRLNR